MRASRRKRSVDLAACAPDALAAVVQADADNSLVAAAQPGRTAPHDAVLAAVGSAIRDRASHWYGMPRDLVRGCLAERYVPVRALPGCVGAGVVGGADAARADDGKADDTTHDTLRSTFACSDSACGPALDADGACWLAEPLNGSVLVHLAAPVGGALEAVIFMSFGEQCDRLLAASGCIEALTTLAHRRLVLVTGGDHGGPPRLVVVDTESRRLLHASALPPAWVVAGVAAHVPPDAWSQGLDAGDGAVRRVRRGCQLRVDAGRARPRAGRAAGWRRRRADV